MSVVVRTTTIIGLNGYSEVSRSETYSKSGGRSAKITYEGPLDKIDELFVALIGDPAVDTLDKNRSNAKGVLTVGYVDDDGSGGGGSTEENNTTWELVPNDIYKPINGFNNGAVNFADANYVQELQDILRKIRQGQAVARPAGNPQQGFFDLLMMGVEEYVRTGVTLRKSINVSLRSTLVANWTNVDRAVVIADTGLDDSHLIGTIADMPEANSAKKQWLKRGPTIRTYGQGKYTIAQDWWFARRWSALLYGGDVEAGNP